MTVRATLTVLLTLAGSGVSGAGPPTGHRTGATALSVPIVDSARPVTAPVPTPARGRFVRPVPGEVLTVFRPPEQVWGAGHRGVDLAADSGTVVRAAGDGVVAFAGSVAGRPVLSVAHTPTLRTTYEPVRATVAVGDRVVAGQPVGVLQAGHASCAPATCVHWGARIGADRYLDPLSLLTGVRVRLLPWDGLRQG